MLEDMKIMLEPPVSLVLDTADPFPAVPYCPPPFVYNSKRVYRPIDPSGSETTRTRITMRSISGHQQRDDEAARWGPSGND